MIFKPQSVINHEGSFLFNGGLSAVAYHSLCKDVIREFWQNFTFGASALALTECDEYTFRIGSAETIDPSDCEYTINVTGTGIAISSSSAEGLIHGYMTLLDRIKATDADDELMLSIDCAEIKDSPVVGMRAVHFCVFPEVEPWELRKFIRFAAALKYTHVTVEFWGSLKYDCMKELAWESAYDKDLIRPILREASGLGIEIIPMFNHWGHASASRAMHGKHVVLDQNPALQTYFSEDGWCWDISKPKVKALLRSIREELCELCGNGRYFHIGCDEAYNFDLTQKENADLICDFINEISDEIKSSGRRAIAWGDMFLYRYPHYNKNNRYECNAPSEEVEEYMLARLTRDLLIADWQYTAPEPPYVTAAVFRNAGFECILCPWDRGKAHIDTMLAEIKEHSMTGYMHTTWHTLSDGMPYLVIMAREGYEKTVDYTGFSARIVAAALMRKVMPADGNYERAGWSKKQIAFRW